MLLFVFVYLFYLLAELYSFQMITRGRTRARPHYSNGPCTRHKNSHRMPRCILSASQPSSSARVCSSNATSAHGTLFLLAKQSNTHLQFTSDWKRGQQIEPLCRYWPVHSLCPNRLTTPRRAPCTQAQWRTPSRSSPSGTPRQARLLSSSICTESPGA